MNFFMRRISVVSVTLLLFAALPAWSQAHSSQLGIYTLRSSTTKVENLPATSTRAHGIERSPRRAVINVIVSKKEARIDNNVAARVQVYARNLTGQRRDIDMREVALEGRVTYLGVYDFVHGEVIDFHITAKPQDSNVILKLTYRERLWAQGDLPDVQKQKRHFKSMD